MFSAGPTGAHEMGSLLVMRHCRLLLVCTALLDAARFRFHRVQDLDQEEDVSGGNLLDDLDAVSPLTKIGML